MNFVELCKERFSARNFSNEPVSKEDLNYILEAARLAPSACNRQPWTFVVVQSQEGRNMLQECYERDWFMKAPVYIMCNRNIDESWIRPADGKQHGEIDVAIATEHLCLAATERGLGTCWVCNYQPTKLQMYFGKPGQDTIAIIALGHIAPDAPKPQKVRKELENIIKFL